MEKFPIREADGAAAEAYTGERLLGALAPAARIPGAAEGSKRYEAPLRWCESGGGAESFLQGDICKRCGMRGKCGKCGICRQCRLWNLSQ